MTETLSRIVWLVMGFAVVGGALKLLHIFLEAELDVLRAEITDLRISKTSGEQFVKTHNEVVNLKTAFDGLKTAVGKVEARLQRLEETKEAKAKTVSADAIQEIARGGL